jgi:hypothetical protein
MKRSTAEKNTVPSAESWIARKRYAGNTKHAFAEYHDATKKAASHFVSFSQSRSAMKMQRIQDAGWKPQTLHPQHTAGSKRL